MGNGYDVKSTLLWELVCHNISFLWRKQLSCEFLPVYQATAEIKPRAPVNMIRTLYFMKKGLLYEHAILSVAAIWSKSQQVWGPTGVGVWEGP